MSRRREVAAVARSDGGEPEAAALSAIRQGLQGAHGLALSLPQLSGSGSQGRRLGRRPGSSLEFQDYRDYQAGDDLRHVDWSVYGRSDQLVIRRFRREVSPHLDLVLDGSSSMGPATGPKGRAAAALAAFFCRCAEQGGFRHRAWTAASVYRPLDTSGGPPEAWRPLSFDDAQSPGELLRRPSPGWRPQGLRLLISDLMWPQWPRDALRGLSGGGAASLVVQVLTAEEVQPTARGYFRLEDCETGERLDLRLDGAAIAAYGQALERHRQAWEETCRQAGAFLVRLVAEELLDALREVGDGGTGHLLELLAPLLQRHLLTKAAKA